MLRWLPLASGTTSRSMASFLGSCTSANGVSAIVLPAYLVSIGFGSKLSMWLTPPFMNSQITLFAFGANAAVPSGGVQPPSLPKPSRCSMAPSAKTAKPDMNSRSAQWTSNRAKTRSAVRESE